MKQFSLQFKVKSVLDLDACFQVLIVITPNVVDVWEAVLTLLFFIILVVLSYSVDVEIWKKKRANDLQEELEFAQQDGGKVDDDKPEKLSNEIKKWASTFSLTHEDTNAVVVDSTPSVDTVRRWTRTISATYPSLSEEDQAKLLAYRVSRTMVRIQESEIKICLLTSVARPSLLPYPSNPSVVFFMEKK